MPNDSSTGGYLTPSSTNDLNDKALAQFLQQVVVGIVGLPGNLVRPRWQPEPPNIPDFGTNWAAIGPGPRKRDPFAAVVNNPAAGNATVVRNRTMEILCSFYGPAAEANSELLAMGLEVPTNRGVMQLQGFNIISGAGDSTVVPFKDKGRWQYRVDIPFTVRQQQKYVYPILNLVGAQVQMNAQGDGSTFTQEITVSTTDGE